MSHNSEPMSQASFSRSWRASAQSMNVDSQDADTQMSQPVEGSQATQDEAMADVPDSKVEVPTSSAVEIPSTPNTKKNEKDDEEVLETPRIQSGQTLKKSNANKSSKSRQKTRETTSTSGTKPSYEETVQSIDASQDGSETIADASKQSAVEEGQATAGSEQANGSQANGAKKERPAFNPYEAASIIPRSPLEIGLDEQRLKTLDYSAEDAASFEFLHEDHTLGNALRHAIMKNPEVELAGYTIPHPSESKMVVRIQMYDGASAYEALEKGIDDLDDMCDVILQKFEAAKAEHMDVDEQS